MIHNLTSVFLLLLTSMVVMFSSESISASDAELIVDAGPDLGSWDVTVVFSDTTIISPDPLDPNRTYTFSWDFDDKVDVDSDGIFDNDNETTGQFLEWVFNDAGYHVVTCTLTDGFRKAKDTTNITIGRVWIMPLRSEKLIYNTSETPNIEIMVERDLRISEVVKVDFVKHHPRYCCLSNNCDEMDFRRYEGGAFFIAGMVGQDIYHRLPAFYENVDDSIEVDYLFERSCMSIWHSFDQIEKFRGIIISRHKAAMPLARAVLNAYAFKEDDVIPLASLFKSKKSLVYSCAKLIADKFNISDWEMLLPKPPKKRHRR